MVMEPQVEHQAAEVVAVVVIRVIHLEESEQEAR